MRSKPKFIFLALTLITCSAAFTLWKLNHCDKTQQAINNTNFLIMTQWPAPAGNPQRVHVVGDTDNYRETLKFSRCSLLEKQIITAHSDFGATLVKSKMTLTRQTEGKEKGWVMDAISKGSHGTRITAHRYFYTDDLGRIVRMKQKETFNGETREQNSWRYHYDDAHRLLRETLDGDETPQKHTTEFHYAENGRLIGATVGHGTLTLRWDDKGRWLSTESVRETSRAKRVRQQLCSAWDQMGNCTVRNRVVTEKILNRELSEKIRMRSDIQFHYEKFNMTWSVD